MAQLDLFPPRPATPLESQPTKSFWRKLLGGRGNGSAAGLTEAQREKETSPVTPNDDDRPGLIRRVSRKVVPGLPRAQTFKRQQSELRNNLEPIAPTPAERRAVSVDRRLHSQTASQPASNPRTSAPDCLLSAYEPPPPVPSVPPSLPPTPIVNEKLRAESISNVSHLDLTLDETIIEDLTPRPPPDARSQIDAASMSTSQYDEMIRDDLERVWILNLSMHFRDKSKREKFFVTYRERDTLWRRVTISLDYRDAPENSLEMDLLDTKFQRDKNAKIYEAIRESLVDIQFYDTVTNLKLQTTDGRLHVHVVEDVNELIHYPSVSQIQHLRCRCIKEKDIEFDSHMSGFVYKVRVDNQMLIKKEIPGPDTIDEFLYEVNALHQLADSRHVIKFHGVVVDDTGEHVKGLLIAYAEHGALIDVIYDNDHSLAWPTRERWARQIVEGLSDIHETGFVQGDFTLSNIVIDRNNDAKIIDINRRGCPVGWEPPEASALIESNQRISMYIGVKSDLYQLGIVLWALATQEDDPEAHGRPWHLGHTHDVPAWYREIVATCLAENPRHRKQAMQLLELFPELPPTEAPDWAQHDYHENPPSISVDDGHSVQEYFVESFHPDGGHQSPRVRTVAPPSEWPYMGMGYSHADSGYAHEPYMYPGRGRSPPSPQPSDRGFDLRGGRMPVWSGRTFSYGSYGQTLSISDVAPDEQGPAMVTGDNDVPSEQGEERSATPRTSRESTDLDSVKVTEEEAEALETLVGEHIETPQTLKHGTLGAPLNDMMPAVLPQPALSAEQMSEKPDVTETDLGADFTDTKSGPGDEQMVTAGGLTSFVDETAPLGADLGNTPHARNSELASRSPEMASKGATGASSGDTPERSHDRGKVEAHQGVPEAAAPATMALLAREPETVPLPQSAPSTPRSRSSPIPPPDADLPDDLRGIGGACYSAVAEPNFDELLADAREQAPGKGMLAIAYNPEKEEKGGKEALVEQQALSNEDNRHESTRRQHEDTTELRH